MSTTPGWHPDPEHPGQLRYWDGTAWTEHRAPATPAAPTAYAQPDGSNNTTKILLGVLIGVFVLCGGGCFAVLASGGDDAPDAPKAGVSSSAPAADDDVASPPKDDAGSGSDPFGERGDQDHPVTVTPGKAFDIRGFKYQPGWRVTSGYIGLEINGLKVQNTRDDKDSALVDFKFWRGKEVLATISCSSDPIAPGTTVTLNCFSGDEAPGAYDKLTIQDTF